MKKLMMIFIITMISVVSISASTVLYKGTVRAVLFEGNTMFAQILDSSNNISWIYMNHDDANYSHIYGMLGQALKSKSTVQVNASDDITAAWRGQSAYTSRKIENIIFWAPSLN